MINMTPEYSTKLFNEVWNNYNAFKTDLNASIFKNAINDTNKEILYYLLLAKYANNPIANMDVNQFKNKVFGTIFQYGPAWEKRLEVQEKIRNLSEEELLTGSRTIYNHSFNPSTDPGTQYLEELTTINDQNTTKFKKAKLDAYALLLELIKSDVSEEFLNKFRKCFKQFVAPEHPLVYITEEN